MCGRCFKQDGKAAVNDLAKIWKEPQTLIRTMRVSTFERGLGEAGESVRSYPCTNVQQ